LPGIGLAVEICFDLKVQQRRIVLMDTMNDDTLGADVNGLGKRPGEIVVGAVHQSAVVHGGNETSVMPVIEDESPQEERISDIGGRARVPE
jgi:hypothetical protein